MIHFDDSSVTTKTKARRRTAGKATGRVVSRVRVLPLVGVRFGPELGTGPASEWDGSDVTNKLAASWCCLQVATEIGGASRSQRGKWTGEQDEFENVGLWMKYWWNLEQILRPIICVNIWQEVVWFYICAELFGNRTLTFQFHGDIKARWLLWTCTEFSFLTNPPFFICFYIVFHLIWIVFIILFESLYISLFQ